MKNHGISKEEVDKYFPKMSLDCELYNILSENIEGAYNAFKIIEIQEQLFN